MNILLFVATVLIWGATWYAIDFQIALGPAGEVYREAGDAAEAQKTEIQTALAAALSREKVTDSGIIMPSSSWVISAVNPG